MDVIYDNRGRPVAEDNFEDDFVSVHRRFKERAAAAFDSDLAELRRKRQDMQVIQRQLASFPRSNLIPVFLFFFFFHSQDRMFDMIDINAEIERAKTTLEAADFAFQRHATKFDNEEFEDPAASQQKSFERMSKKQPEVVEVEEKPKPKGQYKWSKLSDLEDDPNELKSVKARKARINSLIAETLATDSLPDYETGNEVMLKPKSVPKTDKRRKNVKF